MAEAEPVLFPESIKFSWCENLMEEPLINDAEMSSVWDRYSNEVEDGNTDFEAFLKAYESDSILAFELHAGSDWSELRLFVIDMDHHLALKTDSGCLNL